MILIDQKKQILLDKVVEDLPMNSLNLYEHLDDMNMWMNWLIGDKINLVEFAQLVLGEFEYKRELEFQQIFISIMMDIFGEVDVWLELPIKKYNKGLTELHAALQNIHYTYLDPSNTDYELIMTLMEEELQDDRQ
jgi:hypothetical protein